MLYLGRPNAVTRPRVGRSDFFFLRTGRSELAPARAAARSLFVSPIVKHDFLGPVSAQHTVYQLVYFLPGPN